jgi:serine/threonine protein kinase
MILVNGYGFKVNIWKLGVCAYKLLTGRFPFEGTTVKKTYADILGKHLKSDLPSFLYKMLEKDPSKRITLQ